MAISSLNPAICLLDKSNKYCVHYDSQGVHQIPSLSHERRQYHPQRSRVFSAQLYHSVSSTKTLLSQLFSLVLLHSECPADLFRIYDKYCNNLEHGSLRDEILKKEQCLPPPPPPKKKIIEDNTSLSELKANSVERRSKRI